MVSEVMQTYHLYLIQKRKMIYSLVTANEIHMLGEILMYRNIVILIVILKLLYKL